jgi:hypothetical protein
MRLTHPRTPTIFFGAVVLTLNTALGPYKISLKIPQGPSEQAIFVQKREIA